MSEDEPAEGFARRWSRLKRAPQAESVVAPAAPAPPVPEEPVEIPPPADSIPLEDITAWLGKRLPDGWREVALRRMWSADISIRDFVGPADYAWDWNVPGGAPGWEPMRVADNVVRLLARAIGEEMPPVDKPAESVVVDEAVTPELAPVEEPLVIDCVPDTLPEPVVVPDQPPRRGGRARPI